MLFIMTLFNAVYYDIILMLFIMTLFNAVYYDII